MTARLWAIEASSGAVSVFREYESPGRAEQAAKRLSRSFAVRRFVRLAEPEYRAGMERPGWRHVTYFAGVS